MKMRMDTYHDRDRILKEFYNSRGYYIFMFGKEWFDTKIRAVHFDWVNSEMSESSWGNDMIIEQICWESDNGYLE